MAKPRQDPPVVLDPTYQDRDIDLRTIVIALAAIFAVVVVSMLGLRALFVSYERNLYDPAVAAEGMIFQTERPQGLVLQVDERKDLAAHRAYEDALLHDLAWVNQSAGLARIPIEDAMRLLAQQGLPTAAAAEPVSAVNTVNEVNAADPVDPVDLTDPVDLADPDDPDDAAEAAAPAPEVE